MIIGAFFLVLAIVYHYDILFVLSLCLFARHWYSSSKTRTISSGYHAVFDLAQKNTQALEEYLQNLGAHTDHGSDSVDVEKWKHLANEHEQALQSLRSQHAANASRIKMMQAEAAQVASLHDKRLDDLSILAEERLAHINGLVSTNDIQSVRIQHLEASLNATQETRQSLDQQNMELGKLLVEKNLALTAMQQALAQAEEQCRALDTRHRMQMSHCIQTDAWPMDVVEERELYKQKMLALEDELQLLQSTKIGKTAMTMTIPPDDNTAPPSLALSPLRHHTTDASLTPEPSPSDPRQMSKSFIPVRLDRPSSAQLAPPPPPCVCTRQQAKFKQLEKLVSRQQELTELCQKKLVAYHNRESEEYDMSIIRLEQDIQSLIEVVDQPSTITCLKHE